MNRRGSIDLLSEIKSNRNKIIDIATSRGATKICIFGSVAKRKDNVNSDIDFLVELENDRSLLDLVGIKQDLEELLEVEVDVVTKGGIHSKLYDKILEEAIELYVTR